MTLPLQPIHPFGSTISMNDGTSQAQVAFLSMGDAEFPFGDVQTHKFANLSGGTRDLVKTVGMIDDGTCSFTMLYNKVDYLRLTAQKGTKYVTGTTPLAFQVVGPPGDGTAQAAQTATFNGIITKVENKFEDNYTVTKTTIDVWGGIVFT